MAAWRVYLKADGDDHEEWPVLRLLKYKSGLINFALLEDFAFFQALTRLDQIKLRAWGLS